MALIVSLEGDKIRQGLICRDSGISYCCAPLLLKILRRATRDSDLPAIGVFCGRSGPGAKTHRQLPCPTRTTPTRACTHCINSAARQCIWTDRDGYYREQNRTSPWALSDDPGVSEQRPTGLVVLAIDLPGSCCEYIIYATGSVGAVSVFVLLQYVRTWFIINGSIFRSMYGASTQQQRKYGHWYAGAGQDGQSQALYQQYAHFGMGIWVNLTACTGNHIRGRILCSRSNSNI